MQLFSVLGLFHLRALLSSRILEYSTGPALIKLEDEKKKKNHGRLNRRAHEPGPEVVHATYSHVNSTSSNLAIWQHPISKETGTRSPTTCSVGR